MQEKNYYNVLINILNASMFLCFILRNMVKYAISRKVDASGESLYWITILVMVFRKKIIKNIGRLVEGYFSYNQQQ